MKIRKILLFSGLLLAGGMFLYGRKRVQDIQRIIDHLQIGIDHIQNVKISAGKLKFKLGLTLYNPTTESFSANALGLVKITGIKVFSASGEFIGQGRMIIDQIDLPAQGSVALPDIALEIPLLDVFSGLLENTFSGNPDDYKVILDIEILGKTYQIIQG